MKVVNVAAKITIAAIIATSGLYLTGPSEQIQAATSTYFTPTALKTVSLSGGSYIKFSQASIVQGDTGKGFVITISVTNGGKSAMNLDDYYFRLRSASGALYKFINADASTKMTIPANATKNFTYYADVDSKTKISDLQIDVIEWDLSSQSTNFERKIGVVTIPATYNIVAPFNRTQTFRWSNQLLYTKTTKATVVKDSENQSVNISYTIVNGGTASIKLANTKFMIETKDGIQYPADLDTTNIVIPARGQKSLSVTASIPNTVSLKDAKLVWYEKKENLAYPMPIATHGFITTTEQTPVGSKLTFNLSDQKIQGTPVEVVSTAKSDTLYTLKVTYELTNLGKESITLPKLQFDYKSSTGAVYPLTMSSQDSITLNPDVSKKIEFTAEVPKTQTTGQGSLLVYQVTKVNDADKKLLMGKHVVQVVGGNTEVTTAFKSVASYTNTNGKYGVTVQNVTRNPWSSDDILQAQIQVSNLDAKTAYLPIPDLEAEVYLDGVKLKKTIQVMPITNLVSVSKDNKLTYVLNTKIPYSQNFSSISIEVKEKVGESLVDIATFKGASTASSVKPIAPSQSYVSERPDKKTGISIQHVKTYTGENTDMIAVDLELINKSVRVDSLGDWVGFFRNSAGLLFPATLTETADLISPEGRVSTMAYALIPKNVGFTGFELLLGEGIDEQGFVKAGGNATAYLNPVVYSLPLETAKESSLEHMDIYPYELSIRNVLTSVLDEKRFMLQFNYDLDNVSTAEKQLTSHNVILELTDKAGKVYEQTIDLSKGEMVSGKNKTQEIIINDNNFFANVPKFETYTLKVYDVINNHKRLVGSKSLEWFTRSS